MKLVRQICNAYTPKTYPPPGSRQVHDEIHFTDDYNLTGMSVVVAVSPGI